ncbi:hypothetical protein LEMLEM_LOCUS22454, partial [Lemmus lemmus]
MPTVLPGYVSQVSYPLQKAPPSLLICFTESDSHAPVYRIPTALCGFPHFAGRLHKDSPCGGWALFRSFRWVILYRSRLLGSFPLPHSLNN